MDDEVQASSITVPPSISQHLQSLTQGQSYTHFSEIPKNIAKTDITNLSEQGTACVLGVDEAGRGPVIGPMVYGVFYLPVDIEQSLLSTTHRFDDSKVLTPAVRASLMKTLCMTDSDLYENCGWAINSLSARDISAGMLKFGGSYNLNAQAMDATIELIRGVLDRGVNVRHVFVDTIGSPAVYQKKLERIFPSIKITVEKKADSLYPCVSAASVVAKVTRDVSCEALYGEYLRTSGQEHNEGQPQWGSGYPSDARCVAWLKSAADPVFGFGSECRFSWGTIKDMIETKGNGSATTDWPADNDNDNARLSQYFSAGGMSGSKSESEELRTWFGSGVEQQAF